MFEILEHFHVKGDIHIFTFSRQAYNESVDFSNHSNLMNHKLKVTAIYAQLHVQYASATKLTLKAPRNKMHLKMSSAEVICCK